MTEKQKIISERAAAFIIKDASVLLMYRKKNGREYYCIPGGMVEHGETPDEAARREVKEETNLDVKTEKILLTFERKIYDDGEVALYHEKSGGLVREYFFLAEDIVGKEKLGGPELERQSERNFYQLQWISLADIDKIKLLPARAKEALINLGIDTKKYEKQT